MGSWGREDEGLARGRSRRNTRPINDCNCYFLFSFSRQREREKKLILRHNVPCIACLRFIINWSVVAGCGWLACESIHPSFVIHNFLLQRKVPVLFFAAAAVVVCIIMILSLVGGTLISSQYRKSHGITMMMMMMVMMTIIWQET